MKMHRSTQLFLYCSGGERSVKCVHPALEREASKEEQRGVVRLLVAEGAGTRDKIKTLSDGIILLHDNASPHTANLATVTLQRFGWETLEHPPYIPNLSPSDFHIFASRRKTFLDVGFIRTRKCKSG